MFEAIPTPMLQRLMIYGPQSRCQIQEALGLPLAEAAGIWSDTQVPALRTRPSEWLLRAGPELDTKRSQGSDALFHLINVTPSLAAWQVSGVNAPTLLAMGGILDFAALAPRAGTRTLMARIPTIVSRLDQYTFELLVDRAYGDYFANWLSAAAKRFA